MNASNDRNMDMIKAVIDAGEGTPREFFYYGMMLYEMDREDEAIEPLSKVNDKSAFFDAMEAYLALHNIYRKKGDFIKARRVLEDNYSALKDKSEYYCYMGLFYKECLNDLEAAKRYYEHALNCKGTYRDIPSERNPEYYYYVPYYLLGQICVAQHKTHEAQDYYQKALSYRHSAHTVALVEKLKRYNQLENMI
jgi:tetratricopeptide (TPR) repeat protein